MIRHTINLSLAALVTVGFVATARAATTHPRSHGMHMVSSHSHMRGHTSAAPAVGADHSADSLNAQSLSRAQGATQ